MNPSRRSIVLGLAAAPLAAAAQAPYPSKPVRIVLPYGAGGPGDVVTRAIAEGMSRAWGQPVIVDNRPGANEIVATEAVARSAPDGYTFLMASESAFSLNPYMYAKVPYDFEKDFVPVAKVLTSPLVLVARNGLPGNSVKELIEEIRRHPGKYNYGSIGAGGPNHLGMAWFANMFGLNMQHIPYRAIPAAIQDVVAGRLDMLLAAVGGVHAFVAGGQLKGVAISGARRVSALPSVPTFAESGVTDFDASFYLGLFAPRGTPPEIVGRLARDLNKVIHAPEFVARHLQPLGFEPVGDSPEQFAAFVRKDRELGARKVKISGAKFD